MCLILFAHQVHPAYKLVVMANRDEFYERPTAAATWWEEAPGILAGKDLQAGGSWMGVSKAGRFAALTNYREPQNILKNAPSRGDLVIDFLKGTMEPGAYMESLLPNSQSYNGYNLLVGDGASLYHYSNRGGSPLRLSPGIYGLSNALLDTPWPKVEKGKSQLEELLKREPVDINKAFEGLGNAEIAGDENLPETGVSLEWERRLSAMHIQSQVYGTRCSTVVTWNDQDRVVFEERTHLPEKIQRQFEFIPEARATGERSSI